MLDSSPLEYVVPKVSRGSINNLNMLAQIHHFSRTSRSIHLGAFRVEMQRESQKDRTILCKYDPTEPGDYRVEVKWSGEHVPGSPFLVMIFDTQEELNRYLQVSPFLSSFSAAEIFQLEILLSLFQGITNPSTPNSDYFRGSANYGTSFGQMSWKGSQTLT